jgi:hypothetical protein
MLIQIFKQPLGVIAGLTGRSSIPEASAIKP